MALIEIPNAYSSDMAASASGRSRLAIVGELIVAVDLINTVAVPGSAVTNDLLSAERGAAERHAGPLDQPRPQESARRQHAAR